LFLAMQYPVEIPGVVNDYFIKAALNAHLQHQGKPPIDAAHFLPLIKAKIRELQLPETLLKRGVNEGFSGDEKKSNEILQLIMLEPRCEILDETDSGLDIDTLKNVAQAINKLRKSDRSFLIITHYPRILEYIEPHQVHIMKEGKMVLSGDKKLAREIEE